MGYVHIVGIRNLFSLCPQSHLSWAINNIEQHVGQINNLRCSSDVKLIDEWHESQFNQDNLTAIFPLFSLPNFELMHPRCVCNIKVHCKVVNNTTSLLSVVNRTTCFGIKLQCKVVKNTTGLLSVVNRTTCFGIKVQCKVVKNTTVLLSVVNRTTCFGLLRGHHQVQ